MASRAEQLQPEYWTDDMTAVRQAVDRLLQGNLAALLDLLADDVAFCVAVGGETPICLDDSGRQPVVDYFTALGGLVTFWQIDYAARGQQLIAWGRERFTVENCWVEGESHFALVFDLCEGLITRFLVVEDLPSYFRDLDPPEWERASSLELLSAG